MSARVTATRRGGSTEVLLRATGESGLPGRSAGPLLALLRFDCLAPNSYFTRRNDTESR